MTIAAAVPLRDRITPMLVGMLAYYTTASFATLTNIQAPIWVMATVYAVPPILLCVALLGLGTRGLVRRRHPAHPA